MQLTSFTDYSLRVLIFLATKSANSSISEITDAYGISRNHIVKVVHNLGKLGYIRTVQGRGGGISLAQQPKDINLKSLVEQTENFTLVECFRPDGKCKIFPVCRLRGILQDAQQSFLDTLAQYSVQDLVQNRQKDIQELFSSK